MEKEHVRTKGDVSREMETKNQKEMLWIKNVVLEIKNAFDQWK